jgi:predicted nucleotidyltransferase
VYDLDRLLGVLVSHDVKFVVVGGVAAALQGAPVLTQDVDVLYLVEDENLTRLERALKELNAVARNNPLNLHFGIADLRTKGHKLAITDAGPLDVSGSLNGSLTYQDLIGSADELEVAGHRLRVLSLERLVELKRELGRPKDRAMLPVLEATLRERERS